MAFGVDDLLMGGLSGIGGLVNNLFAGDRQEDAQAFNAQQAQINRDFEERMSSTAYQRSMADMEKAGLNPILAYQKGGASSPSGSMASTTAAPVHDVISTGINTALAHQKAQQENENMKSINENIMKDTRLKIIQGNKADAETLTELNRPENVSAGTAKLKQEVEKGMADAVKSKLDAAYYANSAGAISRGIGTAGEEARRASSALSNVMNPVKTFNQVWKDRTDRGM
uniref:Capsid protein VP2-related protein n=1 Tax=Gokushovirinae environmental samples TaxID=1478972 RepID=A0A2R3UAM0_9VIRU|nr:capsid protein VP2-related protein [Gokushovirinae environmental samples]